MRTSRLLFAVLTFACVGSAGIAMACGSGATACCGNKAAGFTSLTALPAPAPAPIAVPLTPLVSAPGPQPLVSGLWAFLNPETGMIDGSIGLMQAPVDVVTIEPDYSNLPQVQLPDGSFMVDTRGIMMDNFIVHIDALGKRTFSCARGANAVAQPTLIPLSPYAER